MSGKVILTLDHNQNIQVQSELEGQELYKAYVALTAHISTKLKNPQEILYVACGAAQDVLQILSVPAGTKEN